MISPLQRKLANTFPQSKMYKQERSFIMKHMSRILALALALIMLLSLATTAFAAGDGEGYTVTIENAEGHTYKIYQIFTGDLAIIDGEKILSNIRYGSNYGTEGEFVPNDVLDTLDPATITPTGDGIEMTTEGETATIRGLEAGYYMIVDVTNPLPEGESPSKAIFQVVGDTTVTSKHTGTTIVKKVKDINDSTGEVPKVDGSEWIDSADYDIGDRVPFQSTATFTGLDEYETYKVIFTDTMAKGLKYNEDMQVWINDEDKTESFTIKVAPYAGTGTNDAYVGGKVITVTCNDITALTDADTVTIVLKYSANLTDDAKLGAPGNPNKIKVTTKFDGTGETPEDVNIVFTYKVNVDKYAEKVETGKELTGADFTLYKEVLTGTANAKTGAAIKTELAAKNKNIKADALADDKSYIVVSNKSTDADGDTFGFKGVDDGNYVLVETTIPDGYNSWESLAFTITATHEFIGVNPQLTDLKGGDKFTGDAYTGILDTNVINESGTELPSTGGVGTTMFYVIGGLMMMAAVVLLVTKKRMANAE